MYIVHICTELAPIAKVGGLADVIYGLSKETVRNNHSVEILIPKYDCIDYTQLEHLKVDYRELWSFDGPNRYNNTVWSGSVGALKVLLLEPHHPNYYFARGTIYGCKDDIDRFVYFCRAALEYLFKSDKRPDVIHIHDWPTSLVATLCKDMYAALGFKTGGILLTLHNLEHQGKCSVHNLTRVGLRGENYMTPEKMQDPYVPLTLNLLKGGIVYSDALNTVSPNYEKEIKTAVGGFGLDKTLLKYQDKMKGILNGIDEAFWNPETDSYLVANYNTHSPIIEKVLEGKAANKFQLRTHLGMDQAPLPLVGCVTRLVSQKAPELIKRALIRTVEKGGQFILLGSASDAEMEKQFRELQKLYSKNKNVAIVLDKDEALAHLFYAAADIFAIPSIFEPCGLTQMISLRYGAVPIARATGGLVDTVFDVDTSKLPESERNGFVFEFPDASGVDWALDRALAYWKDPKKWQSIMLNGMRRDLSWRKEAYQYFDLYEKLKKGT